jgi:hypothetical protein
MSTLDGSMMILSPSLVFVSIFVLGLLTTLGLSEIVDGAGVEGSSSRLSGLSTGA